MKHRVLHIRLSEAELQELKYRADREPVSAYVRRMLCFTTEKDREDTEALEAMLPKIGDTVTIPVPPRYAKESAREPLWKNSKKRSLV